MVSSIIQHALGCDCPCWPKPRWCSGWRRQHELLTPNWKTWEFPTSYGDWICQNGRHWHGGSIGCYSIRFIQALPHWSKQMQKEYVHPCCNQDFSFFSRIESEHCQAVRLAFVTWRRRLPSPPYQRCCSDLICVWRGINGEHWFRFQKLSFELSRSHGHYSYKYFEDLD